MRERGIAFSLEEFTPGICGIGVAIKAQSGFPVGSLTLAIPTVRFNADSKQRGITVLESAAERLHRQAEFYGIPPSEPDNPPAPNEEGATELSQVVDGL